MLKVGRMGENKADRYTYLSSTLYVGRVKTK